MPTNNYQKIRGRINDFRDNYNLNICSFTPISDKTYILKCETSDYFYKESNLAIDQKYRYLYDQGLNNILYPLRNKKGKFLSIKDKEGYYVMPYIDAKVVKKESHAASLATELTNLHLSTSFRRQLTPTQSRHKMEEIYEYLDYKFIALELFVRTVEARPFDEYSIVILKNYHIILDSKKDLADLQKKLISDIKSKKSIDMSFVHNNPKLNHLLSNGGVKYLISLDKSKTGVGALDISKFYIENEDLNLDLKEIIMNYFSTFSDDFYFNYFCFMVLFYYIKGIKIYDKDYVTSQSFINASNSIKRFRELFLNK